MDRNDILDRAISKLIRGTVDGSAFDTASSHPNTKGIDMVIAARALTHRRSAKLAAPDDQRRVQHPALFEVIKECRASRIRLTGSNRHRDFHVPVMVPCPVVYLNTADTALQQTACEEAVAGECAITGTLDTVALQGLRTFILHVGQLRDRELHPKGHFVLRDACRGLGIQRLYGPLSVDRIDGLNQLFLEVTRIATGTCNVVNGISLCLKRNALVAGWEKAC